MSLHTDFRLNMISMHVLDNLMVAQCMDWIELECPDQLPDAVPCRGVPWLAASDDPAFPATIPYARESLLRIRVDCRE